MGFIKLNTKTEYIENCIQQAGVMERVLGMLLLNSIPSNFLHAVNFELSK